jgi:Bacterial PH domain
VSAEYVPPPRGLPGRLPDGERMLWQGAPDAWAMARNVFHVRALSAYLGVVIVWSLASVRGDAGTVALGVAQILGAAAVPLLLVALYSWLVARSTVYTITDARVVIRLGTAFPMTVNLPYARIQSAALKLHKDGSGDISLLLAGKDRLAYMVLWPHARPWRVKRAEPTLRAVPDAAHIGQVLARALAASADLPARAMVEQAAPQEQQIAVPA